MPVYERRAAPVHYTDESTAGLCRRVESRRRSDASPYRSENAASNPPFQMQLLEDLCFLERHLNGRNTSRGSAERLLVYFTMGEGQWKTTPTWPPRGSEPQRWYFASGGMLMRDAPTAADGADRYAIDLQATTGTRNRWMTNNTGDDVVYGDRGSATAACSHTPASHSRRMWKSRDSQSSRCTSLRRTRTALSWFTSRKWHLTAT